MFYWPHIQTPVLQNEIEGNKSHPAHKTFLIGGLYCCCQVIQAPVLCISSFYAKLSFIFNVLSYFTGWTLLLKVRHTGWPQILYFTAKNCQRRIRKSLRVQQKQLLKFNRNNRLVNMFNLWKCVKYPHV